MMPRVTVDAFVGPSNELRSFNADCERTVNRYLEATAPGQAHVPNWLAPCPGVRPFGSVADSPGTGIFYQDGRCFVVVGNLFAELFSDGTATVYGVISRATSVFPTTMVSNGTAGHQLLIASGGGGYVFDLNANTLVKLNVTNFPGTAFPDGSALMVEFLDGYGIVLMADSRQFFISALEDFTSWDPLDTAERSEASDNFVGVIRNHRELWFMGTKTSEVWYDSGDALFPFAPVPGTFLDSGAASAIMTRVAAAGTETIAWLSLDERGHCEVKVADGYTPKTISTAAVANALQATTDPTAARMFCQQQQGHVFLWVTIHDVPTTWVYDFTYGAWHERSLFNVETCEDEPHLASNYAFAFNKHLITDRLSGVIYELDLSVYDNAIVP